MVHSGTMHNMLKLKCMYLKMNRNYFYQISCSHFCTQVVSRFVAVLSFLKKVSYYNEQITSVAFSIQKLSTKNLMPITIKCLHRKNTPICDQYEVVINSLTVNSSTCMFCNQQCRSRFRKLFSI